MAESVAAFAANVARLRASRGWTLREMGEMTGMSASTALRAEQGKDLYLSSALALADVFGVPLGDLVGEPDCAHCRDAPPRGFTCDACGAKGAVPGA
jgi:transcriptional regulator with XRE-family HTH domain